MRVAAFALGVLPVAELASFAAFHLAAGLDPAGVARFRPWVVVTGALVLVYAAAAIRRLRRG